MTAIDLPNPASHVIQEPPHANGSMPFSGYGAVDALSGNLVISVASAADLITPWGANPRMRDAQLRAFWPTEHIFASGLFTTIAQYVAFGWELSGPPRMVKITQEVLQSVQFGQGMQALLTPVLIDYFTQDNGAHIEIVRTDDDPRAPVVSLNHLDSYRCLRTGRIEEPIIYIDIHGKYHRLKWYNVLSLAEMPMPQEEARGLQMCALSRMLRGVQIMRDVNIVAQEKAAGRFTRQIHLVSGVQTRIIEDARRQKQAAADAAGLMRFVEPLIIASLDPTAKVDVASIDFASIPADYDPQKALQDYILVMSMAFGSDYQSFAPLPGGGLGSASQSKVLNMKSRAKGPALFMKKVETVLNFHGIIPRTVVFSYGEQDLGEQAEKTSLAKDRATLREIMLRSGEITTEVARRMAVDSGDLSPDYLVVMQEKPDPEVVVPSTIPAEYYVPDPNLEKGKPGPDGPPTKPEATAAGNRPENSNDKRNSAPSQSQKRGTVRTSEAEGDA